MMVASLISEWVPRSAKAQDKRPELRDTSRIVYKSLLTSEFSIKLQFTIAVRLDSCAAVSS
jgi:hypothetical protein